MWVAPQRVFILFMFLFIYPVIYIFGYNSSLTLGFDILDLIKLIGSKTKYYSF